MWRLFDKNESASHITPRAFGARRPAHLQDVVAGLGQYDVPSIGNARVKARSDRQLLDRAMNGIAAVGVEQRHLLEKMFLGLCDLPLVLNDNMKPHQPRRKLRRK